MSNLLAKTAGLAACGGLLALLLATRPCIGQQWIPVDGPLSGEVTAVAVTNEGLVVAGTAGKGIFLRRLSDEKWTRSSTSVFDGINVRAIVVHHDRIVVATAGKGVWRSSDGGVNWSGLNAGLGTLIVHALRVTSNERVLAGASDGLYSLSDSDNWTALGGGIGGHDIRTITQNGSGTLFAGSYGRGVMRSTDGGLTWELLQSGLATTIIRSLTVDADDRLYAGTFGGDVVQVSEDDGDTWSPSSEGLEAQGIWSIAVAPDGTFLAGARSEGIFASPDGRTWHRLPAPVTTVSGFAFLGNRFWAATRVGLLVSEDPENDWRLSGIPFSRINALHRTGSRILAGLQLGGVHYSDDQGASWTPSSLDNEAVLRFADDGNGAIYAGTLGSGLWRSTDSGETWKQVWKTVRVTYSVAVDPAGDVLTGTDSGIYRLVAGDTTWRLVGPPGVAIRSVLVASAGTLVAGSEREGIWRSTDGGEVWMQAAESLRGEDLWIWDLIELPSGKLAAATTGLGAWLSDDDGSSWQPLPGTGDVVGVDLTLSQNGELVAVGLLGQVFLLTRGAPNAVAVGPQFLPAVVRAVTVLDDGTVLIGTDPIGVYVLDGLRIVANEPPAVIPSGIALSVFPNPAAGYATISLRLERPSNVRWEIVDMLGRVLETGREKAASGTWTDRIDVSRLGSGTYWMRVHAANLDLNRSIVVVK